MEVLISLTVTRFLPSARAKGSLGPSQEGRCGAVAAAPAAGSEHRWLSAPVPHSARSRLPAQRAACCLASEPQQIFSAENHISCLWIQSVPEAFSYFYIFLWKLHIFVSSTGLKCPLCFLFFFCISQEQKSVSYPAALITELKLESSLPHPGEKNIVPNIFLVSNPYMGQQESAVIFFPVTPESIWWFPIFLKNF